MFSHKLNEPRSFSDLKDEDKDLTMFTITKLTLTKEKGRNMVYMAMKLKRKVATELLTTYLPTILLLLITFTTIFFDKDLFGDAIAVNLTIMLVMTTIFTSKIEELPPTSDMKMIDIWLICCLVIPFLEVILRTTIECLDCSCDICQDKKSGEKNAVVQVFVGNGGKVAPEQVTTAKLITRLHLISYILTRLSTRTKREEAPLCQIIRTMWWMNLWRCQEEVAQKGPGDNSLKQLVIFCLCPKSLEAAKYYVKPFLAKFFFSETWALPITVVVAIMAYALLAVFFYNMDA